MAALKPIDEIGQDESIWTHILNRDWWNNLLRFVRRLESMEVSPAGAGKFIPSDANIVLHINPARQPDLTVYDEDETTILHHGAARKFWTVDDIGTQKEVFVFKESICKDDETHYIYAERTKSV